MYFNFLRWYIWRVNLIWINLLLTYTSEWIKGLSACLMNRIEYLLSCSSLSANKFQFGKSSFLAIDKILSCNWEWALVFEQVVFAYTPQTQEQPCDYTDIWPPRTHLKSLVNSLTYLPTTPPFTDSSGGFQYCCCLCIIQSRGSFRPIQQVFLQQAISFVNIQISWVINLLVLGPHKEVWSVWFIVLQETCVNVCLICDVFDWELKVNRSRTGYKRVPPG